MGSASIGQKQRIVVFLLNAGIALAVHYATSGSISVNGSLAHAWLIAICAYWLLTLVSAPYFLPPKDSVATSIGALVALLGLSVADASSSDVYPLLLGVKITGIALCCLALFVSLVSIATFEANSPGVRSKLAYRLGAVLGRGELLFAPVVVLSALGGYRENLPAAASILIFWILASSVGLFERLLPILNLLSDPSAAASNSQRAVGVVLRFDNPGLARIHLSDSATWSSGDVWAIGAQNSRVQLAFPVFEQPSVDGRLCTALLSNAHVTCGTHPPLNSVVRVEDEVQMREARHSLGEGFQLEDLAGLVVEGSTISIIRIECISKHLRKGKLLVHRAAGLDVYYQIIDSITQEEALTSQMSGRQVAVAQQLGSYSSTDGFSFHAWVPEMNSCVFLVDDDLELPYENGDDDVSVGVLPGTNSDVFADIDDIVHFHAAVLGVTGTGKTELSLDLVRAAIGRGCKVVCVDFTGEYSRRLADLAPLHLGLTADLGKEYEDAIFAVETGAYGAPAEKAALKKFVDRIRPMVEAQVDSFLRGDASLAVLELAEITNTKATLRTTELYLSAFMAWAKSNRRARRILLVLEEAHTIVPESGGSGMDYDSKWVVERIGQIALQGRKYGIGLLVVSQRTALVSKTILSQCNTFFVFSLVDQTSLGFLSSVFSADYVSSIPSLRNLEMICYGRALSSDRPLMVKRRFDGAKVAAALALSVKI